MKTCRVCYESKPISEFHRRNDSMDGHRSDCKECVNARNNLSRANNLDKCREAARNRHKDSDKIAERHRLRYASDPEYKEAFINQCKKSLADYPEKAKARKSVMSAIRRGFLLKPATCEHCGTSEKNIQGHHWSYLPEHWLDVIWLCTSCHGKEHKRLNELGRDPDKLIEMENVA